MPSSLAPIIPLIDELDTKVAELVRNSRMCSPGTALAVLVMLRDTIAKADPAAAAGIWPERTEAAARAVGKWRPMEPIAEPMED